jgi:hypothetical protein
MISTAAATALDAEPVPHATPLMTAREASDDELNQQISDVFASSSSTLTTSVRASRPKTG